MDTLKEILDQIIHLNASGIDPLPFMEEKLEMKPKNELHVWRIMDLDDWDDIILRENFEDIEFNDWTRTPYENGQYGYIFSQRVNPNDIENPLDNLSTTSEIPDFIENIFDQGKAYITLTFEFFEDAAVMTMKVNPLPERLN